MGVKFIKVGVDFINLFDIRKFNMYTASDDIIWLVVTFKDGDNEEYMFNDKDEVKNFFKQLEDFSCERMYDQDVDAYLEEI